MMASAQCPNLVPPGSAAIPFGFKRVAAAGQRRALLGALLALTAAVGIWLGLDTLSSTARLTLIVFALALVAWSVLRWAETPVALTAGLALVGLGATSAEAFYAGMGDDLIWLLIGAFVLAAVLKQSGLAERFALALVSGAATVKQLFYRLTWIIAATALVIPSTSGRAALLLPVFLTLAAALPERNVVRALALLFPTVILLSACASLLGAGAHLVAVDFMAEMGLAPIGFFDWLLLGAPFAVLSSLAATELILRLFLDRGARAKSVHIAAPRAAALTSAQRNILAITAFIVALWACGAWHGLDAAVIALGGALLVTWKDATGVAMKAALKGVEWNLILFLAATLVMGEALVHSGAANWLAESTVRALPASVMAQPWMLVGVAALVAMLAHLVVTSRSARAVVLIPAVALPLSASGLDPAALIFLTVISSGFCQTFSVSAKPVALYAKLDTPTYAEADLTRLSLWLMPVFALLLIAFALWVWPLLGLPILTVR